MKKMITYEFGQQKDFTTEREVFVLFLGGGRIESILALNLCSFSLYRFSTRITGMCLKPGYGQKFSHKQEWVLEGMFLFGPN